MRRRRPGGSGGYGRLEEEGEDGFHYDAYISVCDADRDWVEQVNGQSLLTCFFFKIWKTQVFFVGPLYQARVGPLSHLHAMDSSDSPLVQQLLTSWLPAWRPSLFDPHTCRNVQNAANALLIFSKTHDNEKRPGQGVPCVPYIR